MPDGWDPCPFDAECENCGHPMRGHFRENARGFATRCGQCRCEHWRCQHGGMQAIISLEEL